MVVIHGCVGIIPRIAGWIALNGTRESAYDRASLLGNLIRVGEVKLTNDVQAAANGGSSPTPVPVLHRRQWEAGGAVTIGVKPELASTIIAIIRLDMAQWCAPLRRQQGGRRESSLAERITASGPNQKRRIRKMETERRI